MDSNPIKDNKNILDLEEVLESPVNGNDQGVIVVDGRGYENSEKKEIFNLVEVIEEAGPGNQLYEEILKRAEEIAERLARKMVPEIAERVIREEIEKIKKGG